MTAGYGSIDTEKEAIEGSSLVEQARPASKRRLRFVQAGIVLAILIAVRIATNRRSPTAQVPTDNETVSSPNWSPFDASYYDEQLIDHDDPDAGHYSQRYYERKELFGGPGSPIFVVMAGEDPVDYLLYPLIYEFLARQHSAYTMNLEHRFYGESVPVQDPTNDDLKKLLHPHQAMRDAVQLIQHKREELGCGPKGTPAYCPVLTVGGSYPGFLAGLLRLVHSDVVDIGYASSAPLDLYDHTVDPNAYFEKITIEADRASPGCADAVKDALEHCNNKILNSDLSVSYTAAKYGVCSDTMPDYITTNEVFAQELMMVIATHFAENNMEFYPPTDDAELVTGCQIFQAENHTAQEKVNAFLRMRDPSKDCFDITQELPPGANGTISAADWSGVGDGPEGLYWDFQSCTLIPECGMSSSSMFPVRPWTLEWLTEHCVERFDYVPHPDALKDRFHFDDLSSASRLLFTNGLVDGWSIASILDESVAPGIRVVNMKNGAHHSDLSHEGPTENDTEDVKQAQARIGAIISEWLAEIRDENR